MSLTRLLLLAIIAYIVVRMIRVFSNIKKSVDHDQRANTAADANAGSRPPDDFLSGDIKDAEFEDLTPPEDGAGPPKSP